MNMNNPTARHPQPASISVAAQYPGASATMKRSQESTKLSKKRRRLHESESSQDRDDDEVISVYSDSSNDGGNLSSNASSPESTKIDKNLMGQQQNATGAKENEIQTLPSRSSAHSQKKAAHDANNSKNTDTDDNEKYCSTCRTVRVPKGVTEGQLFHVVIRGKSSNSNNNNNSVIGVKCPKGVKAGDTIIIVEPGSSPPLSPEQIARINEQRLLKGIIDTDNAKWVAISFWKIVWPVLVDEGWCCKKESLYNFGFVTFYAPTSKQMSSDKYKLNQEYFESISAVLGFHTLSPALVHMCYADAEKRKMKSAEDAAKANASSSGRSYAALDRWKYPNGIGELKRSRVGTTYQADNLPEAGTFSKAQDSCCILEPIVTVKENDSVKSTWLDWANDDAFANEFHCKILEAKKEFRPLAALIDKPIGFCIWYYYCKYKPSDKYVVLKNLLRDSNHESGEHLDECVICDDGGDLICCDSCPNAYHLSCLGLNTIDDEKEWFCPDCTEERTRHLSPRKFAPSPSKFEKSPAAAGEASTAVRQLLI
ncbi:hypothetical protein ACHAWT_004031 [Skeletonema menzelii]